MVLPASPPDDPQDPEASWTERIAHLLQLARRGVLILVDQADNARLRELFLALLPGHPDLELYTDPRSLVDLPEGTTLVLAPSVEHADWLNISRPLFAERALRVILWCDAETSKVLARRATDFFDWISHRVECPPGVPAFAVEGLRCALLARAPGVIWRGKRFDRIFQSALPRRRIRWLSAKTSSANLTVSIVSRGSDWIGLSDLDSNARLRLIQGILIAAKGHGRIILDHPVGHLPGWHLTHDCIVSIIEARRRFERLGVLRPGRLVALAELEPETLDLAEALLEGGVVAHCIEDSVRGCLDPGIALARIYAECQRVDPFHDDAALDINPPLLRAYARDPRARKRRRKVLEQFALDPSNSDIVAIWADEMSRVGDIAKLLSSALSTQQTFSADALTSIEHELREALALLEQSGSVGDDVYAMMSISLAVVLSSQARYEEAEPLLRRALAIVELLYPANGKGRGRASLELAVVLMAQGRPAEAEPFAEQAMHIIAKAAPAPWVVDALCRLAVAQNALGREEALATACRALEMVAQVFAPDDPARSEFAARIDQILANIHVRTQE